MPLGSQKRGEKKKKDPSFTDLRDMPWLTQSACRTGGCLDAVDSSETSNGRVCPKVIQPPWRRLFASESRVNSKSLSGNMCPVSLFIICTLNSISCDALWLESQPEACDRPRVKPGALLKSSPSSGGRAQSLPRAEQAAQDFSLLLLNFFFFWLLPAACRSSSARVRTHGTAKDP